MITVPTVLYVVGLAPLASVIALVSIACTVALASGEVAPLPEAVAVLVIEPALRSACVMVCVAVQLVVAPGARGPAPQGLIAPCLSSLTENGPASVTLPELVRV